MLACLRQFEALCSQSGHFLKEMKEWWKLALWQRYNWPAHVLVLSRWVHALETFSKKDSELLKLFLPTHEVICKCYGALFVCWNIASRCHLLTFCTFSWPPKASSHTLHSVFRAFYSPCIHLMDMFYTVHASNPWTISSGPLCMYSVQTSKDWIIFFFRFPHFLKNTEVSFTRRQPTEKPLLSLQKGFSICSLICFCFF